MAKEPVVKLQLMTGEVIFELVLSALAVEYAREHIGFMQPEADFRLFLDDEEIPPSFPLFPHREIDARLDATGLQAVGHKPGVGFTEWHRWRDRGSLQGSDLPGVYLLAHFQATPGGPGVPTEKQIVYIGATESDRSLAERWQDFDRAIAGKANNHSGGKTYRRLFGHRVDDLYVAALPVRLDKGFSKWFRLHAEATAKWEYVWQWGSPPMCNRG
jgi:hypothetical protein